MLETTEEKRRFLASSEMMYDPMYQASMDSMWHHWLQPQWEKQFKAWINKQTDASRRK